MKYLFLLTIIISCVNEPGKVVVVQHDHDTVARIPVRRDSVSMDINDPFETGKDTVRLNAVMDNIFKFPEVEAITRRIQKSSEGRHSASIMVHDEFQGDTSYYHFMVGDNSHQTRYVNLYDFLMDKKTGQIKVYDHFSDSILNLQDWRRTRK